MKIGMSNIIAKLALVGCMLVLPEAYAADQNSQTVVADGIGVDLDGAIQNSAENALIQLVGSFVDSQKSIEKQVEIRGAVKEQSKSINSRTSEYSQGTIQAIEVLSTYEDGALTRVTSKVTVRLEDFKAYMKRTALGETTVNQGLFAKVQVQKEQSGNLGEIVIDRLMMEVFNLEVVRLDVGVVDVISDPALEASVRKVLEPAANETLIKIPVKASIDEAFLANAYDTLAKTAERGLKGGQVRSYGNDPHSQSDMKFWVVFADFWRSGYAGDRRGDSISDLFDGNGKAKWVMSRALNSALWNEFKESDSIRLYAFAESSVNDLCAYADGKRPTDRWGRADSRWPSYYVPSVKLQILSAQGEVIMDSLLTDEEPSSSHSLVASSKALVLGERPRTPGSAESALTFIQYDHESNSGEQCVLSIDTTSEFDIIVKLTDQQLSGAHSINVALQR